MILQQHLQESQRYVCCPARQWFQGKLCDCYLYLQHRECIASKKFQLPTKSDYNCTYDEIGDENCTTYSGLVSQCPEMSQVKSVLEEIVKQNCRNIPENARLETTDIHASVRLSDETKPWLLSEYHLKLCR